MNILGYQPGFEPVYYWLCTNSSFAYFQLSVVHGYIPKKATDTIWIKQQFHIYSIIYHAYFACATVPAQYTYHKKG